MRNKYMRFYRFHAILGLSLLNLFLLSACNRLAENEKKHFPTAELKGKVVFVYSGQILVHDFNTGKERPIVHKADCSSPRWSPDGNRIIYKAGGKLFVVNADGTNDISLHRANLGQVVCQWLDDDNVIIGGTILNLTSLESRNSMPLKTTTGRNVSNRTINSDFAAVNFLNTLSNPTPVVCNIKDGKWFIRYAYPFLLPQATQNGIRFSLLDHSEETYNCNYQNFFYSVFVADTKETGILFNSPQISNSYGDFPVWSPDGNHVAVGAWSYLNRDDGKVIYIFDKYSETPRIMHERYSKRKDWLIGGDIEGYSNPRWSPDSRFVVSNHWTTGGYKVYIYDMISKTGIDIFDGNYASDPDWHN